MKALRNAPRRLRGIVSLAALCIAAASGCAHNYVGDAPTAESSAGGVTVRLNGTLYAIGQGTPAMPVPQNLYMVGPWTWTVAIRVKTARPQIGPFADGRKVKIVFGNPIRFFGTNSVHRGDKVSLSLEVWRDSNGTLRGIQAPEQAEARPTAGDMKATGE